MDFAPNRRARRGGVIPRDGTPSAERTKTPGGNIPADGGRPVSSVRRAGISIRMAYVMAAQNRRSEPAGEYTVRDSVPICPAAGYPSPIPSQTPAQCPIFQSQHFRLKPDRAFLEGINRVGFVFKYHSRAGGAGRAGLPRRIYPHQGQGRGRGPIGWIRRNRHNPPGEKGHEDETGIS